MRPARNSFNKLSALVLLLLLCLASCRKPHHSVEINWVAPPQPLSYYDVFRSTQPGIYDETRPYASHIEATRFIDTDVAEGQTYYYRIRAVRDSRTGLHMSALSEEVSAVIPKRKP